MAQLLFALSNTVTKYGNNQRCTHCHYIIVVTYGCLSNILMYLYIYSHLLAASIMVEANRRVHRETQHHSAILLTYSRGDFSHIVASVNSEVRNVPHVTVLELAQ